MSYPENTLLTKPVRRTILVFLILTFFIISPIIIFYTAGYRYDFERHKIQQTGVLSINAKPRDAVVTINGVVIDNGKRLPLRLSNRAPGTYWVTLNKDGYYPWEKSIVIRSNETTYIRDVTLIKKTQPGTLPLDISSSKEVVASEDGRYLAILSENNSVYTVVLYDIREKVEHPLFSEQLSRC